MFCMWACWPFYASSSTSATRYLGSCLSLLLSCASMKLFSSIAVSSMQKSVLAGCREMWTILQMTIEFSFNSKGLLLGVGCFAYTLGESLSIPLQLVHSNSWREYINNFGCREGVIGCGIGKIGNQKPLFDNKSGYLCRFWTYMLTFKCKIVLSSMCGLITSIVSLWTSCNIWMEWTTPFMFSNLLVCA